MRQAICAYAESVVEKLREDRQFCHQVSVFIRTSLLIQVSRVMATRHL
ncbi:MULTISPECIES: hypothetical protein [Erwiniaceae]|nr:MULTISPECIES: hypothetical protein [Erwiniaceae]